jgi:hypothetical protein
LTDHSIQGTRALQLFCHQAAAAHGLPVKGLSGAPVIVGNRVVGLMRRALLQDRSEIDMVDAPRAEGGTLFACPAQLILDRCVDLLPTVTEQHISAPRSSAPALLNERLLLPLNEGRQRALVGQWRGTFHEEIGPTGSPLDGPFSLELIPSGNVVEGKAHASCDLSDKRYDADFAVVGGLLYDRFFVFTYHNIDETTFHFGTMITELSAAGRSLGGRFVAYGMIAERVVYGTIAFTKQE